MKKPYIDSRKNKFLLEENLILKDYLKEKLGCSEREIKKIVEEKKELVLPVSIFRNKLSTLEAIVKYLHEREKLAFVKIAVLLKRDERTIWHAYQRSLKKKIGIRVLDSEIKIPVTVFSDRKYSSLESLVAYLKNSHQLKFTEIAALLELSPKTVWTIYRRAREKNAST